MSMKDWAKNEVKLACEREKRIAIEKGEPELAEYAINCYKSALKAYNSLLKDGHSGYSIGITKALLNRLIDGRPLTTLEDGPDEWADRLDGLYQHKRMGSLFKDVHEDGSISFSDTNRVDAVCVDNPNICWRSGLTRRIVDEMFPITMPYAAEDYFRVYSDDCLTDRKNGDFDTVAIFYIEKKSPAGTEKIKINRYFRSAEEGEEETYPGWIEISRTTYNRRKKKAEERIHAEQEEETCSE